MTLTPTARVVVKFFAGGALLALATGHGVTGVIGAAAFTAVFALVLLVGGEVAAGLGRRAGRRS